MKIIDIVGISLISFIFLLILLKQINFSDSTLNERLESSLFTFGNRYYYVLVGYLFFIAIVVRIYQFGSVPDGFNQDGAMASVDALALSQYGTDRFGMVMPVHFTAWGYGQMSVLLSYLMVPFIKIFGLSPLTARLPLLIVSLVAIYIIYKFSYKLLGKWFAITALAVITINPWQIMQSRWALDCNLFPHFFLFGTYAMFLGLKKRAFMYVSMVMFALSMYSYGISFYTVPVFLFIMAIYLLVKKLIKPLDLLICIGIYLIIAAPILMMVVINIFKLPTINLPFMTIAYFSDSIRMNDLLFLKPSLFQLLFNIKTMVQITILQFRDLPWNSIDKYGPLYFASIPFIFIGSIAFIYRTWKQPSGDNNENSIKKAGLFILCMFGFIGFFAGSICNGVNINRINIFFYPLIIFISYGMYILFKKFKLSVVLISILYAILFIGFTSNYFGASRDTLKFYFYDGFGNSLKYVDKFDYDKIYITTYTQSENAQQVAEILTLFYHKTDSKYFLGNKQLVDKKGAPILPYNQRYIYSSFKTLYQMNGNKKIVSDKFNKAVFVVNNQELEYFDTETFNIKQFEYYSALIPIQ